MATAERRRWGGPAAAPRPLGGRAGGGSLAFKQRKLVEADEQLEKEVRRMEERLAQAQAARAAPSAGAGREKSHWRGARPSRVTGLDPTVVQALTRMLPKSRYPGDGAASVPPEPVPNGTGSQPRPAGAPFNRDHGAPAVSPAGQERAEAAAAAKREAERAAAKEAKEAKEREWAEMQLNALKERARQRQQLKECGHTQAWAERKGVPGPSSARASRVSDCAQWQVPIRAAPPVSREASEIAWMRQVASQISEEHENSQGGVTPRVPSPPQPEEQVEAPKAAPRIVRRSVHQCKAPPVQPVVEVEQQQECAQKQVVACAVPRQHAWGKLDEDGQDSEDHESQIIPRVRLNADRWCTPPVYEAASAPVEPTAIRQRVAAQKDNVTRVEPEEDAMQTEHEQERQAILAEVRAIAAAAATADAKCVVGASRPRRRQQDSLYEADDAEHVPEDEEEVARAWREGAVEEQEPDFDRGILFKREAVEAEAAGAEAATEAKAQVAAQAEAVEALRAEKAAAAEAAQVAEAERQEVQARRVRERLAAIQAQERAEAEARAARELEWERERQELRNAYLHNEQRCREEQERNEARQNAARRQSQAEAGEQEARRVRQSAGERARAAEARAAERRFVTAVCRLQALVRGRRGRRRAAAVSAARAASSGSSQWSMRQRAQEAAVVAAAVRLQAVVRGREGRRHAATVRERRREERAIALAMRGDEQQRKENLREVLSTLPTSRDALAAAADLCATQMLLPVTQNAHPTPMDNQQRPQSPHQPPSQGQGCSSDDREVQEVKLVLKVEQARPQRQPKEQQQQQQQQRSGGLGRANRGGVSRKSRGAKIGLRKGAPRHHAQVPGANAPFPNPGESVSLFVPLSGARSTTELLERCDEAIASVTGGGQRSSRCWSYATSRGELIDVDDFTELHEVRLRAAYLFATVCAQPPQQQRYA